MNKFRRGIMLIFMLCKRLWKKPSFLAILATTVVIAGVMSVAVGRDSSMLRVDIVGGENSAEAASIVKRLTSDDSVVSYTRRTAAEAEQMLRTGQSDAVWDFGADFDSALAAYISGEDKTPPIHVTLRENNVFASLTLERLYAEVFPAVSINFYRTYLHRELEVEMGAADSYYHSAARSGDIVEFSYYNSEQKVEDTNFLVTPLRGLLALTVVLGALSSVLYYMHDRDSGHMDAVPLSRRWVMQTAYTVAGVLNVSAVAGVGMALSGLMGDWLYELAVLALYALSTVGFATLVGGIITRTRRLAPAVPVLMIIMLAVCPVFLNVSIPYVSCLFPSYWYLTAAFNAALLPQMALYTVAVWALSAFVSLRRRG